MEKRTPDRHMTYHEVREAMATRECPICRLAGKAVFGYIAHLLWESVNDPGARGRIRAARGFCNYHTYQVAEMSDGLSLAIITQDLVEATIEDLPGLCTPERRLHVHRPAAECPVCRTREEATERYLSAFVAHLGEPDWRELFAASKGLCRTHTVRACALAKGEDRAFLVETTRRHLEVLKAQLAEVIRKYDYRFSGESWGDERDAPGRAAEKMGGALGAT